MEIRFLEEFVCLADTCNFQLAASQLQMSQSSLSKHIQKIEEELETPLFNRTTRAVKLNDFGVKFYQHAKLVVQSYNEALQAIDDLRTENQRRVTVGFIPALSPYGIVELIAEFNRKYPNISTGIVEGSHPQELLQSRHCDFIFAPEDALNGSEYRRLIYKRDCMAVLFPKDHPLAGEEYVTLNQVRDENFIEHVSEQNHILSEKLIFQAKCQEKGFSPRYAGSAVFSSTIVRMVDQRQGCAAMYRMRIPFVSPDVRAVNIVPEIPFNVTMFYIRNQKLSGVKQTFLDYVKGKARDEA